MTRAVLVLLVAALAAPALRAEGGGTFARRAADAAALAQQGETDAAYDAYRRLVDDGFDSPGVRYNLGTLALEQGRTGLAVLHLQAALRGDPLDEDAAYNLAVAKESRTDHVADVGASKAPWDALGERTHPLVARGAFFLAALLFSIFAAAAPWTAPGGRARRLLAAGARVTAVALLVAGAGLVARLLVEGRVDAVVLAAEAPARKGPSDDAAESFTAHEGLSGVVVEERDGWARLRLENGLEAWIEVDALGFVGPRR